MAGMLQLLLLLLLLCLQLLQLLQLCSLLRELSLQLALLLQGWQVLCLRQIGGGTGVVVVVEHQVQQRRGLNLKCKPKREKHTEKHSLTAHVSGVLAVGGVLRSPLSRVVRVVEVALWAPLVHARHRLQTEPGAHRGLQTLSEGYCTHG